MAPQLSILIVNWNSWPDLRRCLRSLRADEDADFEIVVIDNGSTDHSVENLRRFFPKVRVQANQTNLGHTRAVNQGFTVTRGDYLLVLDADTEPDRDAVAVLLSFLINHPDAALAAPRTYNTDGSVQETARSFPSLLNGLFGRQSLLTRLFPNNRFSYRYLARDKLTATAPFQVEWISSACMMLRRTVIGEAGPWDDGYQGYWVDADWCMRLKRLGKKVFCVPRAGVVHHENNQPGKKKSPWRIWMFHRGAYRLYRKYYALGPMDPRALLACVALGARALLLIMREQFRTDAAARVPTWPEAAAAIPDPAYPTKGTVPVFK